MSMVFLVRLFYQLTSVRTRRSELSFPVGVLCACFIIDDLWRPDDMRRHFTIF